MVELSSSSIKSMIWISSKYQWNKLLLVDVTNILDTISPKFALDCKWVIIWDYYAFEVQM
jgi:hypothetical protein